MVHAKLVFYLRRDGCTPTLHGGLGLGVKALWLKMLELDWCKELRCPEVKTLGHGSRWWQAAGEPTSPKPSLQQKPNFARFSFR